MQKTPVYKGSRAFLAGAKGSRRFTSLSQNRCETFVKRQKREKGLESPVDRGVWKWKRFFENTHARYTHARTFFSCRHWALLLIQPRDSCLHQKAVPLSEKSYHFWKSPTIFPPLQLSHAREQLSRTRLQLSLRWLSCSRRCISCIFQKRPHIPRSLYLQGLQGGEPIPRFPTDSPYIPPFQ